MSWLVDHLPLLRKTLIFSYWGLGVSLLALPFLCGLLGLVQFVLLIIPLWPLYILALGLGLLSCLIKPKSIIKAFGDLVSACVSASIVFLPIYLGINLSEAGRRTHIRSIATPSLIHEISQKAKTLAAAEGTRREDGSNSGKLQTKDLPPGAAKFFWGNPSSASYNLSADGNLSVSLTWGASLIGHHGLVISDKPIPVIGFPSYGGNDDKPHYPHRYYSIGDKTYVMIDKD